MNRALRIIENADRRTHIQTMLESTDLLDVKQRVYFDVLMLMYRAQNHLLPQYICTQFTPIAEVQPYSLRNNIQLRCPVYLSTATQNSFAYKGAMIYNDLQLVQKTGVTASASQSEYKKAAKQYVKRNIASHNVIN